MRRRGLIVTAVLYAAILLSSFSPGACRDGRRSRGGRAPRCPSSQCRCRWAGGRYRQADIRVNCRATSEGLPTFTQTDTIYGDLVMASRNISAVPPNAFVHIRTRSLDLSDNWLDDNEAIDGEAFRSLERHLETLSLQENGLPAVPVDSISPLRELRSLRLERNNISHLDPLSFINNTELRELYLYENRIHSIDSEAFHGLDKLEHLKLMSNRLGHIPPALFRGLRRLTSLDLSRNMIHELPADTFRGLVRLKWLELQGNQLQNLTRTTFRGLKRLRHLKVEMNPLRHLDRKTFKVIRKLRYLSMDIIYVEGLNPKIFKGLRKLKMLSIGDADSASLPRGLFGPLSGLRFMTVFNKTGLLNGLPERLFDAGGDISRLNIFVAPLRSCKCDVTWINALTSRGVWIRGQCGVTRGRHQRRLSCLVPGRRTSLQVARLTDGG